MCLHFSHVMQWKTGLGLELMEITYSKKSVIICCHHRNEYHRKLIFPTPGMTLKRRRNQSLICKQLSDKGDVTIDLILWKYLRSTLLHSHENFWIEGQSWSRRFYQPKYRVDNHSLIFSVFLHCLARQRQAQMSTARWFHVCPVFSCKAAKVRIL